MKGNANWMLDKPSKAWLMVEMVGLRCGFCGSVHAVAPRNQPRKNTDSVRSGCICYCWRCHVRSYELFQHSHRQP